MLVWNRERSTEPRSLHRSSTNAESRGRDVPLSKGINQGYLSRSHYAMIILAVSDVPLVALADRCPNLQRLGWLGELAGR